MIIIRGTTDKAYKAKVTNMELAEIAHTSIELAKIIKRIGPSEAEIPQKPRRGSVFQLARHTKRFQVHREDPDKTVTTGGDLSEGQEADPPCFSLRQLEHICMQSLRLTRSADGEGQTVVERSVVIGLFCCFSEMEFFTVILEKSSRLVLPHNFVKMLDGHRPQNMKLRQAGNGLRKLWDVEVVFDADGCMYLDHGWKQFVRAYDLGIGYFLVFRYDDNATFAVKVFDTTMCRRRYQDDDDAGNGSRSSEYCDRCYVYGSSDSGSKSSSDSGDGKSGSDDGLAMDVPQLGDRAMPIVVEEYIPQPGLGLRRSKRIKMMKEKVKK
ncbi:B3 domain-containing protein [Hordeum vulgare]|nr:B3 domain-containing protein [Hordeum vulgare]